MTWIAAAEEEQQGLQETCEMDDDVMSNAAYYRSREEAERESAHQAPSDEIRKIHFQLAERYAALAEEFEGQWRASPSSFG